MSDDIYPTQKELDLLRLVRNLDPYERIEIKLVNNRLGNVSIMLFSQTLMQMELDKN